MQRAWPLNPASALDDVFYVGIHGNDSLPNDGGVWAAFDPDGSLWPDEDVQYQSHS